MMTVPDILYHLLPVSHSGMYCDETACQKQNVQWHLPPICHMMKLEKTTWQKQGAQHHSLAVGHGPMRCGKTT